MDLSNRLTFEEARARVRIAPKITKRAIPPPPKGKGGELWQKFYDMAMREKTSMPEKFADSMLRMHEKTLEIEKSRHRTQVTDKVPKPQETSVVNTGVKRGRTLPSAEQRCRATKMDGKQCEFKRHPECGEFCSKHAIKNL
jgi:hypothetical protein